MTAPQTGFLGNDFEASFLNGADQRYRYLAPAFAWYPQELATPNTFEATETFKLNEHANSFFPWLINAME